MANFFDIADNWNKTLQREVEASNARQAELEANLTKALQPLIDECTRRVVAEFPVGAPWIGRRSFERAAHITKVSPARVDLYRDDYDVHRQGMNDVLTVPVFSVVVDYKSVPSPKKGSVIDGRGVIRFYIDKDGNLKEGRPDEEGDAIASDWTGETAGWSVRDYSEDWS